MGNLGFNSVELSQVCTKYNYLHSVIISFTLIVAAFTFTIIILEYETLIYDEFAPVKSSQVNHGT